MFLDHTHTHTHPVGFLARRACPRGHYLHNTQQTQENNIHALRGIRTRDLSNVAAADLRLRPHGHRDRPHLNSIRGTIVPASSIVDEFQYM